MLDHLGSTVATVRANGYLDDKNKYFPYGQTISRVVAHPYAGKTFMYTGQELDEGMNIKDMYYYGARYYDPELHIFMQVDPMHQKHPSIGPYAYCANNPMKYIDPTGMDWYETDDGHLHWYDDDFIGPIPGEYYSDELYYYEFIEPFVFKNIQIPHEVGYVPNRTADFNALAQDVKERLGWADGFFLWDTYRDISNMYRYYANHHFYDIKQADNPHFGQLYGSFDYIRYGSFIYKPEDMGNMLYGIGGAATGLNHQFLLLSAGVAQMRAGTSEYSWWDVRGLWKSYNDDARDQHFIRQGLKWFSD